ncbi:4-hydroxyphenylacetate 3-monooxygenase, reductase component [Vibrio sp. SCSIO 43137]|uniref:4-hydroxyphenylacetate 3-monooxygenase, reductase component n=1 Tax=Vibrio sp. SCSIO 43137 TaxID=3021011 RepID=UPI0023078436|nr:4-hydroxyphenylacetate 3-monooxygenase, reductase component [Vibrio sp. SCSIO 43137]WCE32053.1 4-hydroxyphenylacetate 3-monooxygenase, reductase component [Vibrio sp. SCSIO 43137]
MSNQPLFRDAMANLAAAVNIVTTGGEAGTIGLTATAVCSVTDSPATIMVCVNRNSASNELIKANGNVCINVCAAEHQQLSLDFAGMTDLTMEERFANPIWNKNDKGVPVLTGCLASLEGKVANISEVGTHSVFFVEIDNIVVNKDKDALVYFAREFKTVECAKPKEEALA